MGVVLRMELAVTDLDRSVEFYREVLSFEVDRREPAYAGLRAGAAVLGLVPLDALPEPTGPGLARARLATERGAGVEIVLEVDDVDAVAGQVAGTGYPVAEPLQRRPWGLVDFRLVDPDGYYLRVTGRGGDG